MLVCLGFAAAAQAGTVSINFQEDGTGDLGVGPKIFTESGASLTVQGFSATGGVDLWEKVTSGDPTETGLGLANDADNHEILPGSFIQLSIPPTGVAGVVLTLVMATSIQAGETVEVTFGDASGVLGSTVLLPGPLTGTGTSSYTIPPSSHPFIDITALSGNVLVDAAVITTPTVPDGGTTILLLGGVSTILGLCRSAKKGK
jgi:hypothetical protein